MAELCQGVGGRYTGLSKVAQTSIRSALAALWEILRIKTVLAWPEKIQAKRWQTPPDSLRALQAKPLRLRPYEWGKHVPP